MRIVTRLSKAVGPVVLAAFFALSLGSSQFASASEPGAPAVSGWTLVKFVQTQPACTGSGFQGAVHYQRLECGFGYAAVSGTTLTGALKSIVKVGFIDPAGNTLATQTATARTTAGSEGWQFTIQPERLPNPWPAGPITIRVTDVDADGVGPLPNQTGNFGETGIILNALGARVAPAGSNHRPGDSIPVNGEVYEIEHVSVLTTPKEIAVPATVKLQLRTPAGDVRGPYGPFTADAQGRFQGTLPPSATQGLAAPAATGFKTTPSIEIIDATYDDPVTGAWASERAGAGSLSLFTPPNTLQLENSFVSDVGWVKPGDTYPSRVFVRNYTANSASGATVTIPAPDGTTFTHVTPANGSGTASISGGTITWNAGSVPAAAADGTPGLKTLIVEAKADTVGQDPQVVWKNLSSTATLTYTGGTAQVSQSHGPKVIPPKAIFDTARYGDRPFAVVPADYFDRKHRDVHTGESLREKINSPDIPGSTLNLYQEISYGQLFPNGTVPSASIGSAGWDVQWHSPRYQSGGFQFTSHSPGGACYGMTYKDVKGTALYGERIVDGWYQLPGDTGYYGGDVDSFANIGAPQSSLIDSACGPIGKAVYDAAHIADPEIDYSDYDTDKDGVVDFFMLVFVGDGGHGASQTDVPPYDNIWPHSSSLEQYYTDEETGLKGYISDDQLKDLEGRPLYYTDASRSQMSTAQTAYPVYVRVGPYNVNPESAIDKASVISHEYGHSLGLPDYYSSPGSGRETLGDWMLMATDKSQNMDVIGKKELGWLVPRVLKQGATQANNWRDTKINTHQIDWVQPNGQPYTLSGTGVNNGEAYVATLPARRILDPAKVPSGSHVWWSGSGNDFGCTPASGHNLDIQIPGLADLSAGTQVKLTFKSYWDIEWDYDYGFVMAATPTDDAVTYTALESAKGYSTPAAFNPNGNSCQLQYGNGLTGTSGSWAAGTQNVDRLPAVGGFPEGGFVDDEYDLTAYAGTDTTAIRFSYSTDPGLARPGWFIDDIKVETGDGAVLYSSDLENGDEPAFFNGGCRGDLSTADRCTAGWRHLNAAEVSEVDHAYLLEMRDRSGFDATGRGENDRDPINFQPGVLLEYTNETTGYGNTGQGSGDAPNQSPLDSVPLAGATTPELNDAAFTAASGRNSFSDAITTARPGGWVDNYLDAKTTYADGNWHFDYGCLGFTVQRLTGTDIALPYNLQGDVAFNLGSGCGQFDYGYGVANRGPTAVAQAKPETANAGDPVLLDGSASYDDVQPAEDLTYQWDVDGNGSYDKSGMNVVQTYNTAGAYTVGLKVTDAQGLSDTDTVTVTVRGVAPDLQVTGLTTSAGAKAAKQGEKVTVTATVLNAGPGSAPASQTELLLDGTTVLGVAGTPALAAGQSAQVSIQWDTKKFQGDHQLKATADKANAIVEGNEANNSATLTVRVLGNRVQNGDFEQANASGTGPEAWSASGSGTSYGNSGTDGSKAASAQGTSGGATSSPTWTSAPVAVVPGETLDLRVSVNATGTSSPASAGVVFLGSLGQVLNTVTVLTAPLTTSGFQTLSSSVTVPLNVATVQIVLRGFSPTDVARKGTVTFDDVGLFAG